MAQSPHVDVDFKLVKAINVEPVSFNEDVRLTSGSRCF